MSTVPKSKIFGIGLMKTGTSSLNRALELLGFSAVHFPTSLKQIEAHDAATDISVAAAFERLDSLFPGSKFIYTVRDRREWLDSCDQYWRRRRGLPVSPLQQSIRTQVFGGIDFDPQRFSRAYARHERRVLGYFADRPEDLLILDVCGDEAGWAPLCQFLNLPIPDAPFPWTNKGKPIDHLIARLAHLVEDQRDLAGLSGVSSDYLRALRESAVFREHDPNAPLPPDEGQQYDDILARACAYFGSPETASAKLKIPSDSLRQVVARSARDRRIRGASGKGPATPDRKTLVRNRIEPPTVALWKSRCLHLGRAIFEEIFEDPYDGEVFLCGGTFKSAIKSELPVNDVDLYVRNKAERDRLQEALRARGAEPISDVYPHYYRLKLGRFDIGVSYSNVYNGDISKFLKRFDLALSAVAVAYEHGKLVKFAASKKAVESLVDRKVYLLETYVPELRRQRVPTILNTINRMHKYARDIRFEIPQEEVDELWRVYSEDFSRDERKKCIYCYLNVIATRNTGCNVEVFEEAVRRL